MGSKMFHCVENGNVLVLEREFAAPRNLVFEMFKKPEHISKFWGPRGWEVAKCTVDFRPGGVWHYCMKCIDKNQGQFFGMEAWGKGIYKAINEPKSFDYVDFFSDKDGNENRQMPSTEVSMKFEDLGATTKLISRGTYASADSLKTVMDMGMLQGITETWDRLEEGLAKLKSL
jgi:uncharacterized protein YndB with AHSA1/START domain